MRHTRNQHNRKRKRAQRRERIKNAALRAQHAKLDREYDRRVQREP